MKTKRKPAAGKSATLATKMRHLSKPFKEARTRRMPRSAAAKSNVIPAIPSNFPVSTLALCAALVISYLALSNGAVYIPDLKITTFALNLSSPLTVLSYLFVHIGINHILSNLTALAIFAYLCEGKLSHTDVIAIFLIAGSIAGIVFALANPGVLLAGASASIAGLMAAAAITDPQRAFPLLIGIPLAVAFVVTPLAGMISNSVTVSLQRQVLSAQATAQAYVAQNKTTEAKAALAQATQKVGELSQHQEGAMRESATQTDYLVHVVGAFMGAAYVLLFRKQAVIDAIDGLYELRNRLL